MKSEAEVFGMVKIWGGGRSTKVQRFWVFCKEKHDLVWCKV